MARQIKRKTYLPNSKAFRIEYADGAIGYGADPSPELPKGNGPTPQDLAQFVADVKGNISIIGESPTILPQKPGIESMDSGAGQDSLESQFTASEALSLYETLKEGNPNLQPEDIPEPLRSIIKAKTDVFDDLEKEEGT